MIAITNTIIFASEIRRWNKNKLPQNICKSLKLHFYQSQKATKKAQPQKSLSDIGFHQPENSTTIADEGYARITYHQVEESARAESITTELLSDQKIQG